MAWRSSHCGRGVLWGIGTVTILLWMTCFTVSPPSSQGLRWRASLRMLVWCVLWCVYNIVCVCAPRGRRVTQLLLPFDTLILPAGNELRLRVAVDHSASYIGQPMWWHREGVSVCVPLPPLVPLSSWPLIPSIPQARSGFGPAITVVTASPPSARPLLPSTSAYITRTLPWHAQSYSHNGTARTVSLTGRGRECADCVMCVCVCVPAAGRASSSTRWLLYV